MTHDPDTCPGCIELSGEFIAGIEAHQQAFKVPRAPTHPWRGTSGHSQPTDAQRLARVVPHHANPLKGRR